MFRLVATDPPTRVDFMSHFELGRTPPGAPPKAVELHQGISMLETEDQARQLAEQVGRGYVAEMAIPEGIRVDRQGRRAGHCNVYATADDLLEWVVRVMPASRIAKEEHHGI